MDGISQRLISASSIDFPSSYILHLTSQPNVPVDSVVPVSDYVEVQTVSPGGKSFIPRFKDSPIALARRIIIKLLTHGDEVNAEVSVLNIAERLFDEIDNFRFQLASVAKGYEDGEDEFSSVATWINQYGHWLSEMRLGLDGRLKASGVHPLFCEYRRSYEKPFIEAVNDITAILNYPFKSSGKGRKGRKSSEFCEHLPALDSNEMTRSLFFCDRSYPIGLSRAELAGRLGAALMTAAVDYKWNGHRLTLNFAKKRRKGRGDADVLRCFSWPLDPGDVAMQSVQRVLGWRFQAEPSDLGQKVVIEFNSLEREEPK